MLGYTRKHLLVLLAAIVCVMTITSLLLMYFIPAPPSQFSIATGGSHQIYEGIGVRLGLRRAELEAALIRVA
jgi:hypothetical protein